MIETNSVVSRSKDSACQTLKCAFGPNYHRRRRRIQNINTV